MNKQNKKKNKGFTLIEILVVVLIIGILAAIAVPKYQESIEKSIMQEAIINLKNIARANDAFFLANGRYANAYEMDKLDISIPGTLSNSSGSNHRKAINTKNFGYRPDGDDGTESHPIPGGYKAIAQRLPVSRRYYIYVNKNNIFKCKVESFYSPSNIQRKLCNQINQEGHL